MHCATTSANNFSGQSVVISRISPVQLAESVRKSPEQPVYFSYTSLTRATFEEIVDQPLDISVLSMVFPRAAIPSFPEWFIQLYAGHIPMMYMATQFVMCCYFEEEMTVKRKNPMASRKTRYFVRPEQKNYLAVTYSSRRTSINGRDSRIRPSYTGR